MGSQKRFCIYASIVGESGDMDIGYTLPRKIGKNLTGIDIALNGERGIGV